MAAALCDTTPIVASRARFALSARYKLIAEDPQRIVFHTQEPAVAGFDFEIKVIARVPTGG